MIKNLIIFAAGVCAGAFAASLYFKEDMDQHDEMLTESIKRAYGFYDQNDSEEDDEETPDLNIVKESHEEMSMYKKISKASGYGYDKVYEQKGGFSDLRGNYLSDASNFPKQTASEYEHPVEEYREPYIITAEEYELGTTEVLEGEESFKVPMYDKINLTYYEDDDVLVDEASKESLDIYETLGYALNNFPKGQDTIYVRNERLGADYEVDRVDGSYYAVD